MRTDFANMAAETVEALAGEYWDGERQFLREYAPPDPDKALYSYLWGYGAWLTTLCSLAEVADKEKLLPFLKRCFERLERYRDPRTEVAVYDSAPDLSGYGEPFYDDNAWVALAHMQMHELTGAARYLTRAEDIAAYLYTGWHPETGGIRWKEFDCRSSNTCSSAPTAVLSLLLYARTGKTDYLDWARRIYDWTAEKLRDRDGVYFDSLDDDGKVCEWKFSYNTGVMIWCGVLLREATGEQKYLDDALASGAAAETFFLTENAACARPMLPKMPWFNVYLLRGWMALAPYRDTRALFDTVAGCAAYAWEHARDARGLFNNDWTQPASTELPCALNLDTLGSAECLAILTRWQKLGKENG